MLELDPSNQDEPKVADVKGDRLRELRLLARLDLSELAKRAALSPSQLEQLENGTHGSFYNASIRRQAARKVALILGADPESVIEVSVTEAMATPTQVMAATAAAPAPKHAGNSLQAWFSVRLRSVLGSPVQAEIKARLPRQLKLAGAAGLTLVMLGVWATVIGFSSDRTKLEPSSLESAAMPVKTTDATQGAPIGPTAQAPSTVQAVDSVSVKADDGCDMASAGFAELQAPKALKGPGMVYVVGATGQVVCVRDAGGQAWRHVFGEERGQSFHGRPPWQLQSPQLAQMQLYFQGSLIRLPAHGLVGVKLQEKESS